MTDPQTANWIAFAALLVMGGTSALGFAFMLGSLHNRVQDHGARIKAIEETSNVANGSHAQLASGMAELRATVTLEMKHLAESVAELKSEFSRRPPRASA